MTDPTPTDPETPTARALLEAAVHAVKGIYCDHPDPKETYWPPECAVLAVGEDLRPLGECRGCGRDRRHVNACCPDCDCFPAPRPPERAVFPERCGWCSMPEDVTQHAPGHDHEPETNGRHRFRPGDPEPDRTAALAKEVLDTYEAAGDEDFTPWRTRHDRLLETCRSILLATPEPAPVADGTVERTTCPTCHRVIVVEACQRRPNDPGDHDPAAHVAQAYHYEQRGVCASDGELWPCPTNRQPTPTPPTEPAPVADGTVEG